MCGLRNGPEQAERVVELRLAANAEAGDGAKELADAEAARVNEQKLLGVVAAE